MVDKFLLIFQNIEEYSTKLLFLGLCLRNYFLFGEREDSMKNIIISFNVRLSGLSPNYLKKLRPRPGK